jgi:hypothetical protein
MKEEWLIVHGVEAIFGQFDSACLICRSDINTLELLYLRSSSHAVLQE